MKGKRKITVCRLGGPLAALLAFVLAPAVARAEGDGWLPLVDPGGAKTDAERQRTEAQGRGAPEAPSCALPAVLPAAVGTLPPAPLPALFVETPSTTPAYPCCEPGSGDEPWKWVLLPQALLWAPPLANQMQPRMSVKKTTLDTADTKRTIDTAIGGTLGWLRFGENTIGPYGRPNEAVQLDFFAVVFTRFSDQAWDIATDYRFGVPLTFASGPWEGKIAYEHTSTHLGDDFIRQAFERGDIRFKQLHVRDEVVLGLAYRLGERWRFYGQFGYAEHLSTPIPDARGDRYNVGVEWCGRRKTSAWGEPYAALDLDMRGDQNFTANWTAQVGWRWQGQRFAPIRLFAEAYDGRSPYGQFFLNHERWLALGMAMDF